MGQRYFSWRYAPLQKACEYEGGFEELYDLTADLDERENKIGDASYTGDLVSLHRLHETLKSYAGPRCWSP